MTSKSFLTPWLISGNSAGKKKQLELPARDLEQSCRPVGTVTVFIMEATGPMYVYSTSVFF